MNKKKEELIPHFEGCRVVWAELIKISIIIERQDTYVTLLKVSRVKEKEIKKTFHYTFATFELLTIQLSNFI